MQMYGLTVLYCNVIFSPANWPVCCLFMCITAVKQNYPQGPYMPRLIAGNDWY